MIRSETNEVEKRIENRKTIKPKGGSLKKKKHTQNTEMTNL